LAIFDEKIEIRERCKGVHCVDLGESFPTRIYLQKSASIQPRTSPSKFGGKFNSIFTSLLNDAAAAVARHSRGWLICDENISEEKHTSSRNPDSDTTGRGRSRVHLSSIRLRSQLRSLLSIRGTGSICFSSEAPKTCSRATDRVASCI